MMDMLAQLYNEWVFSTRQDAGNNVLVCVFQRFGADGLNLVVPYSDPNYYKLRPTIAIPEPRAGDAKSAINLDGQFGLHPALAPLLPFYQAGSLAIVDAVGQPDPSHSHFDAQANLECCLYHSNDTSSGWLGRHLASQQPGQSGPLKAVGIGYMLQLALYGPIPVIAMKTVANFRLAGHLANLAAYQSALDALYQTPGDPSLLSQTAGEMRKVMNAVSKIDSAHYQPEHQAAYPDDSFGRDLQQVAMLIKAGLGLQVACVDIGGWDTHAAEGSLDGGTLDKLAASLGQGLAAFATDLGDRMNQVTLLTMTEFGRRVQENGSQGTDHGHGAAMFVLGGGVAGGKVHGVWPTLAPDKLVAPGDLAVTTDFRDVFAETLTQRLGNPNLAAVFPNYTAQPVGVISSSV
jgi:uncharacterized protein (DUF1501 family)